MFMIHVYAVINYINMYISSRYSSGISRPPPRRLSRVSARPRINTWDILNSFKDRGSTLYYKWLWLKIIDQIDGFQLNMTIPIHSVGHLVP